MLYLYLSTKIRKIVLSFFSLKIILSAALGSEAVIPLVNLDAL